VAQFVTTQFIDDLDGTEIGEGQGETMTFSLDGRSYEIDLSSENARKLRETLSPYLRRAHRSTGRRSRASRSRVSGTRRDPSQTQHIREWAQENGLPVSDRGRIPAHVVEAYEAAH
jgi:Lsr2